MKKTVILFLVLFPVLLSAQAVVSAPATDALLAKVIAAEEVANAQFVTEFIPRVQQTIDLARQTLDTSKRLYEIGKSVADYGPQALVGIMKEQFCAGFPGACPLVEGALKELERLPEVASLGKGQFLAYKKSLSGETGRFISGLAAGMVKAYRYPKLADALAEYVGDGVSAVDEIFTAALAKKGMAQNLLTKTIEAASVQAAVKTFLAEADRTGSLTAQGLGVQLGIEQAQAQALETIADIGKSDFVKREVEEELTRQGLDRFYEAYRRRLEEMKKNKELKKLLETNTEK